MPFNWWDWDKSKELEGIFTGFYPSVGQFRRRVYSFKIGEIVFHSWDYAQLSMALRDIPFKTKVRIKYLGKEKMPDTGYMAKSFQLQVLQPAEDYKPRRKRKR